MKYYKLFIAMALCASLSIFGDSCQTDCGSCGCPNPCGCEQSCNTCCSNPCDCNTSCDPCNTCCSSPCCCEPCDFVPPCPPEECAYNAPVLIDIKCGWDIFITGSFVYFQAKEENLEYVTLYKETDGIGNGSNYVSEFGTISFDYEPAFRVGLGFSVGCDNWALYAEYFRYHADVGSGSFSVTAGTDEALNGFFLWTTSDIQPEVADFDGPIASANAKWRLEMDLVDVSLSRRYFVGRCLTFQPFFGLRGGWIDQKYTVSYVTEDSGTREIYEVTSSTESWAVGVRAGLDTDWKFCGGFFLFGNAAMSILYTDYDNVAYNRTWKEIDIPTEATTNAGSFTVPSRELCFLRPQLNIGLGLGWSDYFCCNDWFFDLRFGYEFHTFWNQNMFIKTFVEGTDPIATGGDLYLHGLVITARLDF